MMKQELTYWVTLAAMPKIWTKRKNEIYANCFQHIPQISIIDLFDNSANWEIVGLNDVEKIAQKIGQQRAGRNLAIKVYELAKKISSFLSIKFKHTTYIK